MPGKLNSFQKTFLQWNEVQAYNAVHCARIPAPPQLERLRAVIAHVLETRRLTGLSLNAAAGTFNYAGGPADLELAELPATDGSITALDPEIQRQLNRPFEAGERTNPFRFFVAPSGDSFWLGLTYFHAIADAEAVVWLMKDLVEGFLGINHGPATAWETAPMLPDSMKFPGTLACKLLSLPAHIRDTRRSHRPPYRNHADTTNSFASLALPAPHLERLLTAARAWHVTLNDLFLALLLKSLARLMPGRTKARRRNQLSVGCIVNTRNDFGVESRNAFGLFLGSFRITHPVPEGMDLATLARDINVQTLAFKRRRLYLRSGFELAFTRFMFGLFSTRWREKFYPKNYPLCGGVTNLNLNSLWQPVGPAAGLDYFRAVSTGPVAPLVLSATSAGDRLNLGFTSRTTVFGPAQLDALKRDFLKASTELQSQP